MEKTLHTQITKISEPIFQKVYSWISPERYWFEKDRSWYVIYSFFFVLLIAFLTLLGEYILVLAVIAFVFLWFVQAAMPPQKVEHLITTIGIKTFGKLYKWKDIKNFWFSEKNGIVMLNIDVIDPENPKATFKKRLTLLTNEDEDKEIFTNLIKFIDYGDKEEIGYNLFTQIIYGKHYDITHYLPNESERLETGD